MPEYLMLGEYPALYLPLFDKLVAELEKTLQFDNVDFSRSCKKISTLQDPVSCLILKMECNIEHTRAPYYLNAIAIQIQCTEGSSTEIHPGNHLGTALIKAIISKYFSQHKVKVDYNEWWPNNGQWSVTVFAHPNKKTYKKGVKTLKMFSHKLIPDFVNYMVRVIRSTAFRKAWKKLQKKYSKLYTVE
ncbi:MAG: hypothetical protein AAB657_03255, partial [Patescibacteria group bacterium]